MLRSPRRFVVCIVAGVDDSPVASIICRWVLRLMLVLGSRRGLQFPTLRHLGFALSWWDHIVLDGWDELSMVLVVDWRWGLTMGRKV